jgi:hypothetical protein
VHAEETEVLAGAETGDDEGAFSEGGGGFFDDGIDGIEIGMAGKGLSADSAVIRQETFVGGLDGRDGAAFAGGDLDEAGGAGAGFAADVEVVADEVEKGDEPVKSRADQMARA